MDSIGNFLEMGGYAAFVWPAFALTFGPMALFAWASRRRLAAAERALEARRAEEAGDEALSG